MTDYETAEVEKLLSLLTLEEKIGMIHGNGLFRTEGVPRLGIPPLKMADGPMGVRQEFQNDTWLPIGYNDDYVTYLPSIGALAATWNRTLAYKAGHVLGKEARGRGKDIILAPGINIKRSPVCGRNFEYMSEDPYLSGEMAVPFVKGVQQQDVAACVKHFAVNNQETERLWVEALVEERALQEIYLPAFKKVVDEGDTYALMGAYNLLHGEHCCQSKGLLGERLRKGWGYEGVVVSDWGGVHEMRAAAESGLDIEMSVTSDFDQYHMANPLLEAVQLGEIEEAVIDEKIRHILGLMTKLHMLQGERQSGSYNTPDHREFALEIARESIVLLKNEAHHLPLAKEKIRKLLIIGDNADRIHSNGGGSAEIKALYEITPLMGLKSQLGGNVDITYARGYYVPNKGAESETNWQETSLENNDQGRVDGISQEEIDLRIAYREEALRLAREAEEIIFIGGLNHDHDLEGHDRSDLVLPYGQDELIKALLEVRPEMVVVLLTGSPVGMSDWIDQAKSLVWMGYAGMEGGNALAEVLLGKTNPSGKLTETFIKEVKDCPAHTIGEFPGGTTVNYKEGIMVGYRYYETKEVPVHFAFGHGLSYTSFAYGNMKVHLKDSKLHMSCEVCNTGEYDGSEVVQLYVTQEKPGMERPIRELKGFEKIHLRRGESREVVFTLPIEALGYYNQEIKGWLVEEDTYILSLGSAVNQIKLLASIEIHNE